MDSITKRIYQLLLTAATPMTSSELKAHFPDLGRGMVSAILNQRTQHGFLTRSGTTGRYGYALSDGFRARLASEDLDDICKKRNVSLGRMRPAETAIEAPRQVKTSATPLWPATPDDRPLSPSLGTPLPWADEDADDVPPWLGERYRDALRPRPVDD
jgi:predicted transcriptional regulator